jgi:hypothetical protein
VDDGNPKVKAGVVEQISGGEVVAAVDDDVVSREDVEGVGCGQALAERDQLHIRIEGGERFPGRLDLGHAQAIDVVEHLALEVGGIHHVRVDDPQRPDPGRGQIEGGGRPQAAGPDQKNRGPQEGGLAGLSDLREEDVAAVSGPLFGGHSPRWRPWSAFSLPSTEAPRHRMDVAVSHRTQCVGSQGAATAATAEEDDLGLWIGDCPGNGALERAAGEKEGPGEGALGVLVTLANVDDDSRTQTSFDRLGFDLGDCRPSDGDEFLIGSHGSQVTGDRRCFEPDTPLRGNPYGDGAPVTHPGVVAHTVRENVSAGETGVCIEVDMPGSKDDGCAVARRTDDGHGSGVEVMIRVRVVGEDVDGRPPGAIGSD